MSLQYSIKMSKDHEEVFASWEINLDMTDDELISNFELTVNGKHVDTNCSAGNKACKGAAYTKLSNPEEDCTVTFVISTNKLVEKNGEDFLRGGRPYDEADFSS